jgi:hypothetical protein
MAEGQSNSTGPAKASSSEGQAESVNNSVQVAETGKTEKASTETKETEKIEKAEKPKKVAKDEKPAEKEKTEETEQLQKHRYHDRLTAEFPDRKFEKDEDYETALDEHLNNLESYRKRGQESNSKLITLFDTEPVAGAVIREMMKGASMREALARYVDLNDLKPLEGDPDEEGYKKNLKERETKLSESKKKQEEFAKNVEAAEKEIEEFAKEHNLDENGIGDFLKKLDDIITDINSGKLTKNILIHMKRGWDYDSDIAKAKEEGALAERNKKIVAEKETNKPKGDGMPKLSKSGEVKDNKEKTYIDDLLNRWSSKQRT